MFQVQDVSGRRYALKRLAVNDQADLLLCKQEIAVMVSGYSALGDKMFVILSNSIIITM